MKHLLSALCALLLWPAFSLSAAEYHVSPEGSDANNGQLQSPFQTIQHGVNSLQPGDTLVVHAGVYRETVTFPRSGKSGQPIVVKAAIGEKVVVSGCESISGWTLVDRAKKIWKAPMPWTLGLGRNQVFCNGEVTVEARHPNQPAAGLEMYVSDLSPLWPTYGEFSIPRETRVSQPGRIVSKLLDGQPDDYWKGAIYCGVHFEGWCAQTGVIESSKSGEIQVGDRTKGWWFGSAYDGRFPQDHEEGRGMIIGHRHALDALGEWYWENDVLYLIPPDGKLPKEVKAKRRQLAFDFSNREHIHVQGLTVVAASMRLDDSAYCVVDHCDLSYISHYSKHYGIGQIENGRDTVRSGETGIFVGGHDNSFLNCSVRISAGAGFHLRGYHHTIHNCLIDEISYVGHYLNAITDAVSDYNNYENFLVGGHAITFNTMRNASRHFFNFYGNGTSKSSRTRGPMDYAATLFAHNHLYNGMLLTRDAGFITGYFGSGGTLNGVHSQVAYNVMHDCYDLSAIRWNKLGMVYLDQGTCQVDVHHNLFWAVPGSLQRDMWFNTCCVGVREFDNVFHGLFTRTSEELEPDDFPNGVPFRFGHDFAQPPQIPSWPQIVSRPVKLSSVGAGSAKLPAATERPIEIKDGDAFEIIDANRKEGWQSAVLRFASDRREINTNRQMRGTPRHQHPTDPLVLEAEHHDATREKMHVQWTFLYNIPDGAWVRFNQVPLGNGYSRFRANYGNDGANVSQLEVRLDRPDGPLVGKVDLPRTDRARRGYVQIYDEAIAELSADAKGTHDVYLVFRSPNGPPAVDFEFLRFEQYRGELALQKNEVQLELRKGAVDGPKVGVFYPRSTAGEDNVRDFVATLEPLDGADRLFLTVRSAVSGPIGTIHGLRCEKGAGTIAEAGIADLSGGTMGTDWQLPQPTHRPCAKPADHYRERPGSRPLCRALRLTASPIVDGDVKEWKSPPLELKQSLEGIAGEDAAYAWIGYDRESFYVALRAPQVADKPAAKGRYLWGAADGVELAFQRAETDEFGPIIVLRGWPDGHFAAPQVAGVTEKLQRQLADAVTYRSAVGTGLWSCEWRIPFDVLGGMPGLMNANLTVRNAGADRWLTWNIDSGASYDLYNGGAVVFDASEQLLDRSLKQSLAVWLDAADRKTVFADPSGNVKGWKDKSGNSRHAVQKNEGHRPRYDLHGLNEQPALQFDGERRTWFELPDLSAKPLTTTVFAVISNPEPGPPKYPHQRVFTASDGKEYDYKCGINCAVSGTETGGPRLLTAGAKDRWGKSVRVGCFSPAYHTFFHGLVAEIMVFDRELTAAERFRVVAYLSAKWEL